MHRRQFLQSTWATAGLLVLPSVAVSQVVDINDAINKAGRQRMLSQRLAKSYMACGQKILTESAEKVLAASMAQFDRQLIELKVFAPKPEIKATYTELEARWGEYKVALVGSAPTKSEADDVLRVAGQVLQLANQGTAQLEAASGKAVGKLINISGRQRMLSQRMAAFYLSASWGVEAQNSMNELKKARDEFVSAHHALRGAPETTPAIQAELTLAESQFGFFEVALGTMRSGANAAENQANVFTTSERVLQVMDGVTGMYAKLV